MFKVTIGINNIDRNNVIIKDNDLTAIIEPSFRSSIFKARKLYSANPSIPIRQA
jgi:hypothetical protein